MNHRLNIAGKLAKGFYNSKITPLMMITIAFVGVIALLITPRMYNPEIKVPAASIIVIRPNTSAVEMENQIVKPLEGIVASIYGVDHTFSFAVDDMAVTTVQFKVGLNQQMSLMRLYNRIMRNYDRMPKGTYQPIVKSIGVEDIPILSITLYSKELSPYQLRRLACKVLAELRGVPNMGTNYIIGGAPKAVNVELNPQKLASYNISVDQLIKMLQASGVFVPAGNIINSNKNHPILVTHLLTNATEVGNVIIGVKNGAPVYLRDVARIYIGSEDVNYATTFAWGKASGRKDINKLSNAVTITIAKKTGANAVFVVRDVLKRLEMIKKAMIPDNVGITIMRNYADKANRAVNTLLEHLSLAVIVVAFILLIFLGFRESLIITFMVPFVLLFTLFASFILGMSINRITLFALILSLGLLVDSGIVVIENLHRHVHFGKGSFVDRIILATDEVGNPTNIATIAVVLAFIPMAFVTGMMGPFMRPIPINVPIAMITSLFLAYTIVPYGSYYLLRKKAKFEENHKHEKKKKPFMEKLYKVTFIPFLRHDLLRRVLYIVVFLAVIASTLMIAWQFIRPSGINGPLSPLGVEFKMLPDSNVNTFLVEVKLPLSSPLEETQRVAQAVGRVIGNDKYVTKYAIYTGVTAPVDFGALMRSYVMLNTPNIAQIRVKIVKEDRPKTHEIVKELDKKLDKLRKIFKNARIMIFENPPGPPTRAQVLAQLYGPSYETLRKTAKYIEDEFRNVYGITNIDSSVYPPFKEYRFKINYDKAMYAGIPPYKIADTLYKLIHGYKVSWIMDKYASEPTYIVLRLPKSKRGYLNQILDLNIQGAQGKEIPLRELVSVVNDYFDQPIYTRDQHQVVYVSGDMLKSSPVYAILYLNKKLNGKTLPNGIKITTSNLGLFRSQPHDVSSYEIRWGGDMRLTLDVFRDLGFAFMAALVFIYFLLVGYYKSFLLPIIVMGPIPLTVIGVFPGHWLLKQPFTATSMIGVIALAGIVIRNSLLLIDFIRHHREYGHALSYSIIESGAVRFRPIILTALAIIFGSVAMVNDPIFGGLAISLIFGTFASTMLSLMLIPLLYYSFRNFLEKPE